MCSFKFATFSIFFLIFIFFCDSSNAKSGCALFGHSCYGGIGKRAEILSEQSIETAVQESGSPALFIPGFHSGFRFSRPVRYIPVTPEQYQQVSQFLDKREVIDQQ